MRRARVMALLGTLLLVAVLSASAPTRAHPALMAQSDSVRIVVTLKVRVRDSVAADTARVMDIAGRALFHAIAAATNAGLELESARVGLERPSGTRRIANPF